MFSTDLLHSFIQSMSKSEKRYFRLFNSLQQGEKGYLRLFDLLERHEVFGENTQQELNHLFPGTSLEPARKHLYRVIMKSLRQFESERSVEVKLGNLLHDSKILSGKGFPEQALAVINKAKTLAITKERFLFYLILAKQELQLLSSQQFAGMNESNLIGTQQKMRELLEHETNLQQHASLYEILLLRYWKTGTTRSTLESARLNDLLLEEHYILNNQQLTSFESRQLHLHFQSVYMLMTSDTEGSLEAFYQLDRLFQENTQLWAETPETYLQLLTGILQTLRRMERFEAMQFFIERMRNIPVSSERLRQLINYQLLELELHSELQQQNYQRASVLVNLLQEEKSEREINQLAFPLQAHLILTITRFHFVVKSYPQSLLLVNRILNQPTRTLSRTLTTSYRLLNLMIHTGMKNTDLLHYEIRASERAFKRSKSWFKTEQLVLKLLKDHLNNKPLQKFEAQLTLLLDDPFERELIVELGLRDWVVRLYQ